MHVQALDIVSVDGQPVGPDNFAARDLVTEIAAMDPGVRPDEIGTPWPIQSQGFFSDASSAGSLHLAFELPGTGAGSSEVAGYAGAAAGSGGAGSGVAGSGVAGAGTAARMDYAIGAQPPAAPTAGVSYAGVAGEQSATAGAPGQLSVDATSAGGGGSVDAGSSAVGASSGTTSGSGPELLSSFPATGASADAASQSTSPVAHAAFEAAKGELGVPYQWGGTSPSTGFDCSGLMQWAYHQAGINLPRDAADQFNVGTPVSLTDLRQGDLVFFRISGGEVDHVGMYVGNNEFIEAPATGQDVQYANLNDPYWTQHFAGARRVVAFNPDDQDASASSSSAVASSPTSVSSEVASAPASVPSEVASAPPVPDATSTPVSATPTADAPVSDMPAGVTPGAVTPGAVTPGAVTPGAVPASAAVAGAAASGTGSLASGTVAFKAIGKASASMHRNTVQFLPAVQPASSASTAQASGLPAEAGQASAAGQLPVASSTAGQINVDAMPGQGSAAQADLPGQEAALQQEVSSQGVAVQQEVPGSSQPVEGAGVAVSEMAGSITVSSPILTSGQEVFAAHLAQLTGLSPRVIAAWELAEESGGYAQARQAASNYNWLNIGYFDSGPGQIAFNNAFSDPVTAAEQTAKFLQGSWGGASASIRAILSSVGQSPEQQISAIANSDWASSHYYGGSSLRGTFNELADMQVQVSDPTQSF